MYRPAQTHWAPTSPTGMMGTSINTAQRTRRPGITSPPFPPPPGPPTTTLFPTIPTPATWGTTAINGGSHTQPTFPPPPPPPQTPSPSPPPRYPASPATPPPPAHHPLSPTVCTRSASPAHTPTHSTQTHIAHTDIPPATTTQIPQEFVQTPDLWDNRQLFGLNLPRYIQATPHSVQNKTAGLPIANAPLVAFLRHNWSSYWLRYAAHGYDLHLMCSKHVSEAVFATELLGMLRARRIDLDQAATAFCWQENLSLAKRPAMTQLVKELVLYIQELQDQYNDTSKSDKQKTHHQAETTSTADQKPETNTDTSPGPHTESQQDKSGPQLPIQPTQQETHDPLAAHRISDLEAQLATALEQLEARKATNPSSHLPSHADKTTRKTRHPIPHTPHTRKHLPGSNRRAQTQLGQQHQHQHPPHPLPPHRKHPPPHNHLQPLPAHIFQADL